MSFAAFLLIFVSAFFHATWNLLAKKNHMSVLFYALMGIPCWLIWCHVLFWTPIHILDLPWQYWCWVLGSATMGEILYCTGLCWCYRRMDISTAYPIMRSLPVLMIALITTLCGFGQPLTPMACMGMAVVFMACMVMPQKSIKHFVWRQYLSPNMLAILIVATGTTCYTICDSQAQHCLRQYLITTGQDVSKLTISMTYYITRLTVECISMWLLSLGIHGFKGLVIEAKKLAPSAFTAGAAASGCYVLALAAMLFVTNVSYVQAFRQMGLVLAMLGGVIFLKERLTFTKVAGVILIIGGLILTVVEKL